MRACFVLATVALLVFLVIVVFIVWPAPRLLMLELERITPSRYYIKYQRATHLIRASCAGM